MKKEENRSLDSGGLLLRPRLLKEARHEDRGLILITAGAGYGKSVLMSQIHDDAEGVRLWHNLDSDDIDDSRLVDSLLQKIRAACPDFGSGLDTAGEMAPQQLYAGFVNSLFEFDQPLHLFLDDFQILNRTPAVLGFFELLFNNIPPQVRLYVASREAPALPLGRLRIQRKINEIDGRSLRFTLKEAVQFLSGREAPVSSRTGNLYAQAEGWPWALALLKEKIPEGRSESESTGSIPAAIRDRANTYFQREIFEDLEDELAGFLLRSSVSRDLDADLCDQVLFGEKDQGESAKLLRLAEEKNLAAVRGESGKYRLHGWFREFLLGCLADQASGDEIESLHLEFGRAAASRDRFALAMRHFIAAGHPEIAALHLKEHGNALLASGKASVVVHWLSQLPTQTVGSSLALQLLPARCAILDGNIAGAETHLKAARRKSQQDGADPRFDWELLAGDLERLKGDVTGSIASAARALGLARQPDERCAAYSRIAARSSEAGRPAEALDALSQATAVAREGGSEAARKGITLASAAVSLYEGRFGRVLAETRHFFGAKGTALALADAEICATEALALCRTGQYEDARAVLERAIIMAKRYSAHTLLWNFEGIQGLVLGCLGEKAGGEQKLATAIEEFERAGVPSSAMYSLLGELHWVNHRFRAAYSAHEKALSHSRKGGSRYHEALSLAGMAGVILHKEPEAAGALLAQALAVAREGDFNYQVSLVRFYQAEIALAHKRADEAASLMGQSLSLASANGYDHFLLQEGRSGARGLALAVAEDVETEYLLGVCRKAGPAMAACLLPLLDSPSALTRKRGLMAVSACGGSTALRRISRFLNDPDRDLAALAAGELEKHRRTDLGTGDLLTRRELQVLSLLAEGLSNADIAARLYISEGTVKTHVGRIFRKLGISRRVQAARYFHDNGKNDDAIGNRRSMSINKQGAKQGWS